MNPERPKPDPSAAKIPPGPPLIAVAVDEIGGERRFQIATFGLAIGSTNLEYPIPLEQRAAGLFVPPPAFARFERIFQLYDLAGPSHERLLKAFVRDRDALDLKVVDSGTSILNARVDLIRRWSPHRCYVHVTIPDPRYWRLADKR